MTANSNREHREILSFDDNSNSMLLFGEQNANLKVIEQVLGIKVSSRGGEVTLSGDLAKIKIALKTLNELYKAVEKQVRITPAEVRKSLVMAEHHPDKNLTEIFFDKVSISNNGKKFIVPKTIAQKEYVNSIRNNDLTFGVGPAGTGKTYLAMALAVSALLHKDFKRIILTRPAVEAGERLGFLPGDIEEKINPYLRPLYDALGDMVDAEKSQYWMTNGIVEVAPLAFMRGRTLNDSIIILDEAQNTTPEQMKMFLTRMGYGSKAIVTGDITQTDLPSDVDSGMIQATNILQGIEGIAICRFSEIDVVRHPLVQKIVHAYEKESVKE